MFCLLFVFFFCIIDAKINYGVLKKISISIS